MNFEKPQGYLVKKPFIIFDNELIGWYPTTSSFRIRLVKDHFLTSHLLTLVDNINFRSLFCKRQSIFKLKLGNGKFNVKKRITPIVIRLNSFGD